MRELFRVADELAPSIVFIGESPSACTFQSIARPGGEPSSTVHAQIAHNPGPSFAFGPIFSVSIFAALFVLQLLHVLWISDALWLVHVLWMVLDPAGTPCNTLHHVATHLHVTVVAYIPQITRQRLNSV